MMKRAPIKTDLTAEYVRSIFLYEPETGLLHHVGRHGVKAGAIAGHMMNHGYRGVKVHQKLYLAHRIIWLYMTGCWPSEVDHKNRIKDDNRWCNLRECDRSKNLANTGVKSSSKTGLKGVHKHVNGGWAALIRENGKARTIGYFKTPFEAHEAYAREAKRVFGEFACA